MTEFRRPPEPRLSLRNKLFILFIAYAVAALASVGIFGYAQSLRSLEALLSNQTRSLAEDAARSVEARVALEESDILLLSENEPTQQLLALAADRTSGQWPSTYARATGYLQDAWSQIGHEYRSLELRDVTGRTVYRLGEDPAQRSTDLALTTPVPIARNIKDVVTGQLRGSLVLEISPQALLPQELLQRKVGGSGYSFVADRKAGIILYHPAHALVGQPFAILENAGGAGLTGALNKASHGTFRMGGGDSARVAAFSNIESVPWTVVSTALIGEFVGPFVTSRTDQVLVVSVIAILITAGFFYTLRQATRSLEMLTVAADEIGRGNLKPALPPGGRDEVGRLSDTFTVMTSHIREMVDQIEANRQMTVLGEFAARIAHEIRNPLTAVKLNLQGLSRDARAGLIPSDSATSLQLSLKEIGRLDQVVHGVLELGRLHPSQRAECSVHAVIDSAMALVESQANAAGISLLRELSAVGDVHVGDTMELQGAFLDLLFNALAASSQGGRIVVRSSNDSLPTGERIICVAVLDDGIGITPELRERIFRPFTTTKRDGTGLGLAIARRTVEGHGGSLKLAQTAPEGFATQFTVELPLAIQDGSQMAEQF